MIISVWRRMIRVVIRKIRIMVRVLEVFVMRARRLVVVPLVAMRAVP
jgi:hypothetical protein